MVNPVRTPTISPNNAFSNQSDQQVQYREVVFNFAQALINSGGGGTVTRSSTGTTAGDGNLWTAATDIGIDTSGNGAWIAISLGGNYGGSTLHALLYTNNASADTTPQRVDLVYSTEAYSGGSSSTLPTTAGVQTTVEDMNLIPWTTVTTGRWSSWYTAAGDMMFGVKEEGGNMWRSFTMLFAFTDSDGGGQGSYRFANYHNHSTTETLSHINLASSANWRGFVAGGTAIATIISNSSIFSSTIAWTGGVTFDGSIVDDVINIFGIAANDGRLVGQPPDVYAIQDNFPFGGLDDAEDGQTFRRVSSSGGIMIYFPTASLPIL